MRMYMQTQIKNRTYETALEEFILTKESEGLSGESLKHYQYIATAFLEFYGENQLASRN